MDTKTRILQAAVSLFGQHGLKGASIRDICSVADANIAAVNYYFGGKEALYARVIRSVCEGTFEFGSAPKGQSTDSAESRLCSWIEWYLRRHDDPRYLEFMSFFRREVADPTSMLKEIVDTVIDPPFMELRALVSELLPDDTSDELVNFHCDLVSGPALARTLMESLRQPIDGSQSASLDIGALIEHTQRSTMASLKAYGAEISDRWEKVC